MYYSEAHFTCKNNLVFDVEASNIKNCGNIILYEKHDGDNQKFKLTYRGNGYHSIDLVGSKYSLDIEGGDLSDGTNVILYEYHGGANQLWKLDYQHGHSVSSDAAASSYIFRSKADENMVLDVDRGSDPNNLIIWTCHGGDNQIFEINKTTSESYFTCNDDLVFDVEAGNIENCGNVILYEKHGGENQQFILNYRGKGYYSIDLVGTDFSLDIEAHEISDGTNVIIYKYHGGNNQLWKLECPKNVQLSDDSTTLTGQHAHAFIFRSKADQNMVLDVDRGADPNNLIIWSFHGGENQVFKIDKSSEVEM